jgi:uncharacterized membrane protein YphA (DoxX/SURF4 family)
MVSMPLRAQMLPRWLHVLGAVPAGGLFLIAGISKGVDIGPLVSMIAEITGAPSGIAFLLGLLLIAVEIAGGLLLILGIAPRISAAALAGLVLSFLLIGPLLDSTEVFSRCHCFGRFTPELTAPARTALDLALLALLSLIALHAHSGIARWSWLLAGLLVLPAAVQIASLPASPGTTPPALESALDYARGIDSLFARAAGTRALLVLDFSDFTCPACYDNILQTIDALSRLQNAEEDRRVLILMRRTSYQPDQAEERLRRWKLAARVDLATATIADSLVVTGSDPQSVLAVFDGDGGLIACEAFPLEDSVRKRLLSLLIRHG